MASVRLRDVLTNAIFVTTDIVSMMKRLLVVKAAIMAMDIETVTRAMGNMIATSVNKGVPNIIRALWIMNFGMNRYRKIGGELPKTIHRAV